MKKTYRKPELLVITELLKAENYCDNCSIVEEFGCNLILEDDVLDE